MSVSPEDLPKISQILNIGLFGLGGQSAVYITHDASFPLLPWRTGLFLSFTYRFEFCFASLSRGKQDYPTQQEIGWQTIRRYIYM